VRRVVLRAHTHARKAAKSQHRAAGGAPPIHLRVARAGAPERIGQARPLFGAAARWPAAPRGCGRRKKTDLSTPGPSRRALELGLDALVASEDPSTTNMTRINVSSSRQQANRNEILAQLTLVPYSTVPRRLLEAQG
jgi:hypothetical protein